MRKIKADVLGYKYGTQKQKIWDLLRTHKTVTNVDILDFTGAYRYGARLWEIDCDLGAWGWEINCKKIGKDGVYEYTLRRK